MAQTFNDGETGAAVRGKINTAITELNSLTADVAQLEYENSLRFGTVADLLADTTLNPAVVPVGSVIEAGGFRYEVAASGATDHHVTTAGGVKLYVLAGDNGIPFDAFSAFSGALTGSRDNAVLAKAVTAATGKALHLGAGPYDFSARPAGLDDVHVIGTPFTKFNNLSLPLFSGVFTGNKQVAVVAAVLRYYVAGEVSAGSAAGWYLLQAKSGAHHDPVLLGPITASGAGSVNLDVDFEEFGIDPALWTPSGFVCGPDETFAAEGVIFGASVGTTSVTIGGEFVGDRTCIVTWTTDGAGGGTLSGTNAPYIFTANADGIVSGWVGSGANRYLRLYRDPTSQRKAYNVNSKTPMIGCRRSTSTIVPVQGSFRASATTTVGSNTYEYFDVFVDRLSDGSQITDATNLTFSLTISDPLARAVPFTFNAEPASGSNIWMVGVFTKKAGDYPA